MDTDVSEAFIAYDEQFEEEDVEGEATAVAPASHVAAAALSGRPAAAALPTDTELDAYLDEEEPGGKAKDSTGKVAAATTAYAQPATLQPAAIADSPASISMEANSTAEFEQPLQDSSSKRHSLSRQASRNSNQALSQQPSRQLSSGGSNRNLQPNSRRASQNSSSRRSRNSSAHAPAAAEPGVAVAAAALREPVGHLQETGSASHDNDFQQQDSVDELVADFDDDYASAAASSAAGRAAAKQTAPSTPYNASPAAAAPASAVSASLLSSPPAATGSHEQAAAPAAVHAAAANTGWWDNEQPQQHQQAQLGRAASHSRQPSSATAAAAAAFSLNSAAAAASAAAGAAAYEAVHAVPHRSGRRQRPASASAGRHSSSHDRQKQEQLAARSSWHADVQEQQPPQEVLPLEQWAVTDVCDWVEGIGLPQYRKKFMHHCIGGRLLLRLTAELLRKELGIGPLGHRALLLDAIEAVSTADLAAAATAAAAGTTAAEFAPAGTPPGAAVALLVAGGVAARAAEGQRSPSRRPRGASAGTAGANHGSGIYTQRQASSGLVSAGSGGYSSAAGWEAAAAGVGGCGGRIRAGSAGASPFPAGRGRPSSAPAARGGQGRSPSPTANSPGALGPAAGRISVYEQRAKLLFELGRAQARAAAQSSSAAQVGDVARLAAEEVARLQGQLADLDRRNRLQVEYAAGSVDSRGHIPWQHVGAGTHAGHPHPESHARPWDPPDTDLTFSPKISAKSQQLMADSRGQGGNGGFLARLGNDLKRRQVKIKELERRYNTFGSGAVSAADADLSLVLGFLSQRGWADLSVPNSSNGLDAGAQQELDEQLDEVVDAHSRKLSLSEAQLRSILAARGHKKVAALAAVVRTQQFMDRYKADLSTRDSRLSELQEKWFKQQLQGTPTASGPTGRVPAVPLTAEQRDMRQALHWFRKLGWDVQEPEDDCEDLLAALIKRARAYKAEVEKLHDKAAAAAATGVQQAAAVGEPQINWQSIPWRDDSLNDLMQKVLDAQKAAPDSAAAKAAAASKPSAVDAALKAAGSFKSSSPAGSVSKDAAGEAGAGAGTANKSPLDHAVQLLAGMRWAGLDQLDAAAGTAKKLALYRALRTQQFLEFTAADLAAREAKQRALWAAFEASRRGKVVSKADLDDFYARLQADGDRRKAELAKAKSDKEDKEARVLALVSVGAGRSTRSSTRSRPQSTK